MEKYEKIRTVGRGAHGTVYLCSRIDDKKLVIVKQIRVDQMTKEERLTSLNESKVLSRLKHPNIIAYYENFLDVQSIVIVMEYASGGTLDEYLQQQRGKLLSEEEVLYYFSQIVLALHHVHSQQILHRDLKTPNILLSERKDIIKIGDFGISKILSSKSKAYTVVGTPSYISPELCEGRPYNQKSDIWALGCILYELLTLKRPFEASNLPALVMKIIRGSFAPVADHYSKELKQLLFSILDIDPIKRPTINQIMAHPLLINPIYRLYMSIGSLPCLTRVNISDSPNSNVDVCQSKKSKAALMEDAMRYEVPLSRSQVYYWGNGTTFPILLPLPTTKTEITEVAIGECQKIGITKNGLLIMWEHIDGQSHTEHNHKRGDQQSLPKYVPKLLEEKAATNITHVACGSDFTAFLTDKSILLTFGNGEKGCLGHGDYKTVVQPKIVEALLGLDVVAVACGSSHVIVLTGEHEVYSWGQGAYGQLGLHSLKSHNRPHKVPLLYDCILTSIVCGPDCSFMLTESGMALACGSNRYNKLAMDTEEGQHVDRVDKFSPLQSEPIPNQKVITVSAGPSHTAILTGNGNMYTVGSNEFGQLGWGQQGLSHSLPSQVQFPTNTRFKYVSCGNSFTVAVTEAGDVYTWGKNTCGELGRQSVNPDTPGKVELFDSKNWITKSLSSCDANTLICLLGNP